MADVAAIAERCRAVLDGNWREGEHPGRGPYAFTCPSPASYPWQWYWDSCFHAIVRRRFDAGRALRELESLLASQREDGFIGHITFWGRPLNLERAIRYNVDRQTSFRTSTIQPPLLAWAWSLVTGCPVAEPRIAAHHDWLLRERDLDGDGLLWLIQPDESGLDASPKFDHVWGRAAQGHRLFPLLIHHNRRRAWSARRIAGDGRPVVCEVLTNVLWALSEQALGRRSPTPAIVERLWDEDAGRFVDDVRNAHAPLAPRDRPLTWDALAPLALPDLPEALGRRLVEELLLDERRFWAPVPLPSVALDDPAFTTRDRYGGLRRYWRGPSWVNAAWLAWLGLRRLGYDAQAADLAERLAAVVLREGLREYYEPRTGAGMGARDFGWSALAWELVADPG